MSLPSELKDEQIDVLVKEIAEYRSVLRDIMTTVEGWEWEEDFCTPAILEPIYKVLKLEYQVIDHRLVRTDVE